MDDERNARGRAAVSSNWLSLLRLLPDNLEGMARRCGAFKRRREVRCASDLLRLLFSHALCDWPLRRVAGEARAWGICEVTDVALLYRFRKCRVWLSCLVTALIARRSVALAGMHGRIRLIDATTVNGPHSRGTAWRIHLSFDLLHQCLDGVEVTDAHGGETLVRHPVQPGDIIVADRGYAHRRGLAHVFAAGGQVLVRTNWQNLPLHDASGERVDVAKWLSELGHCQATELATYLHTESAVYPLRLVTYRLSQAACDAARRRARKASVKKHHQLDERTLFAAQYILLVSNLSAETWSAEQLVALYRLRWQVEVHIKRLKSILHLDNLRAVHPETAQVYLLTKLVAALLVDELIWRLRASQPAWFSALDRPISMWDVTEVCTADLSSAVPSITASLYRQLTLPGYAQYLVDTPRSRKNQLQDALAHLPIGPPVTDTAIFCQQPLSPIA